MISWYRLRIMMSISRQDLSYDFQGARFDLENERDRRFLSWVFSQFLYGEVTGIQCGHWLYRAPHLNAASFIAKQAGEELSHVRKILRILTLLGGSPEPAHPAIRFLSTGMMGGSWGEHVVIEMALGEGLVLSAFYALADTIDQPEIKKILESAITEEERHVVFGERETRAWLSAHPRDRKRFLALALVQVWALRKIKKFMLRRMRKLELLDHPVMGQFSEFYDQVVRGFALRMKRLGLCPEGIENLGLLERSALMVLLPIRQLLAKFKRKPPLLTSTYLDDPVVRNEAEQLSVGAPASR